MNTLTANLVVTASFAGSRNLPSLNPAQMPLNTYGPSHLYTLGTDADGVDVVWAETLTLDPGQTIQVDIANLTAKASNLFENFGFATVKEVLVEMRTNADNSTQSSGVRLFGAASNSFQGWMDANAKASVNAPDGYYAQGDSTGITVGANSMFQIENKDGSNYATVRVTFYGIKV